MSIMDPDTPGITIVAEATTPRINKITIFTGVTEITVRASLLSFKSGIPPEITKAITNARIPNTPIPPEVIFDFMEEMIAGSPPRIRPTNAIHVTNVCLSSRYSIA